MGFDVLSLGRLAVDLYANDIGAELAAVKSFNVYAGGCPTNVAVGMRRLGLNVAMVSRLGTDGLSDGLLRFLEAEGIDTTYVTRDSQHLTGLAFLSILPPDTFPLVYYRPDPADLYLSLDDLKKVPIETSRVLFVSGTGLSADPSRSTTLTAMERAKAAGVTVAIDLDLRKTLWQDLRTYGVNMRAALPLLDIVIGTEDEITAAADQPDVESAVAVLLRSTSRAVAVKRGQAGSEVHTPEGDIHRASPFKVEVLNVLGAGDAWASGFLFGYLNGWNWEKCARFGNATGAIIVTRHACANDMPYAQDVMAFIEQQGGF
ncbi:MAG: 5-dehydro-2-deoxygluconokinase [Anaerolineae bacterium]|nr:5-dehydro-2-deoxygluconokinase [Anaerolineae bacterium]